MYFGRLFFFVLLISSETNAFKINELYSRASLVDGQVRIHSPGVVCYRDYPYHEMGAYMVGIGKLGPETVNYRQKTSHECRR